MSDSVEIATEIMEVTCLDCGVVDHVPLPEGDSAGVRWVRRMLETKFRCDGCLARAEEIQQGRERKEAREGRRNRCQLPRSLRGQLLAHLTPKPGQEKAVSALVEWASADRPGSLVLTGQTGVGKTHLAGAACWSRLERWPCTYASVARSMSKLARSFTDEGRVEAVRFFSGNGDAVLDDLDKCRPTDFGREQLFAAVDGRQQEGSALLVTTNLTPDQIGDVFGEPLMSRLAAPHCRVVEVGGEDWRVAA